MKRMSWRGLIEGGPASGRVLVVDDDPDIRKAVSRLHVRSGYG
jgi:CheY-like chemotaxis protein